MGFSSRSYTRPYLAVPGLPRGIKWLLIVNVSMFVLHLVRALEPALFTLALNPLQVVSRFYIWQLFTYSFVHFDFWEILWNMLTLWMFGSDIEQSWGTDRFLKFYMLCATGPAILAVLVPFIFGIAAQPMIGAWAPIYGILLVCAVLWPDRQVLFIIFPMQMKYFTILVGAIAVYFSLAGGLIYLFMLSGMAFGYLFLKMPRMRGYDPMGALDRQYKSWKLARAKRKFQVYLKKKRSDRDTIN
jgi:membrane associated rhomboid family serine protease